MNLMDENQPEVLVSSDKPFFLKPKFLITIAVSLVGLSAFLSTVFFFLNRQTPDVTPPFEELVKEGTLTCPLDGFLCQLDTNYQESSFSAQLDDQSPIYAVFDGTLEKQKQPDKDLTVLVLTSKELNLQAFYYFDDGITLAPVGVKKGDVLGITQGKPIPSLNNKSFVFYLVSTEQKNQLIPVTLANFKNE